MCIRDRPCITMATVLRAAKRLQQPAFAGARQSSVLVNYTGAKAGKGPVEVAEQAHGAQATTDWRKYSYGAALFVAGLGVVEGFLHLTHAHSHEAPVLYPFRKIRNKAFPWGNGQESLFGAEIDHTEE
eukprot:TRINITY_DN2636_c0_g1_i2.p1 TRINITY_DN2636_c0_g1~~TRINITY_DN2636_c0_g1_i2.p1  ORF type:complete len:128 (-),score=24.89 TRINITY_DN2636_c0_g1_i2:337-720(-)